MKGNIVVKKVISLALVIVILHSIIPLPAGASASVSNLADADNISYIEAVDVMTAIGAIDGFPDGLFYPRDGVTRAQAAALVTRLLLGRELADSLPVVPTGFSDVDGISGVGFAVRYIAYCVSQNINITAGYSNSMFGPNDPITATQFAVMVLSALGYGTQGEYDAVYWETNAVLHGITKGIFDDVSEYVDFTKAVNREEIAQYAFNALGVYNNLRFVKWDSNKSEYVPKNAENPESIMSKVYKNDLVREGFDRVRDDLGRPQLKWTYKDYTIHIATKEPERVFISGISQNDLYKVTGIIEKFSGKYTNDNLIEATLNQADLQVDGKSVERKASLVSKKSDSSASEDIYGENGRGIITEIYKVNDVYFAVIIKPSYGKVKLVDTKATAMRGAYTKYSIVNPVGIDYSENSGITFNSIVDEDVDIGTVVLQGFVGKDDMVLFYYGNSYFHIEAVNTITGRVTNVTSNRITISENTYALAVAANITIFDVHVDLYEDQSFFVDRFNYILGIKEGPPQPLKLALVVSFDSYSVLEGNKVITYHTANIVDLDGKVFTVQTMSIPESEQDLLKGVVCTYTIANSLYAFVAVPAEDKTEDKYRIRTNIDKIENGSYVISPSNFQSVVHYTNNTTRFVVVNYDNNGEPDGTITVYIGINHVPNFPILTQTTAVSYDVDGDADQIAEIIYIYDKAASARVEKLVYVLGTYSRDSSGYQLDVIKEGAHSTIAVTNAADRDKLLAFAGKLVNEIRVICGLIDGELTEAKCSTFTSIWNRSGFLMINSNFSGYTIADDVPVYTIEVPDGDSTDISCEELIASDLQSVLEYDYAKVHLVTDGTRVMAVYIISYVSPYEEPTTPVITIVTQPAEPVTVTVGSIIGSLSITAIATEGAVLRYQWYSNTEASNSGGSPIPEALSADFTIPTNLTANTYYYYCVVSTAGGIDAVSSFATVIVNAKVTGETGSNGGPKTAPVPTVVVEKPVSDPEVPLSGFDYLEMDEHRIYLQGYSDGAIRPNDSISRAEVATIFYRLLKDTYQNSAQETTFIDVPNDAWFSKAIGVLVSLGIVKGYSDSSFRPNNPITRAEFAALIARFDVLSTPVDYVFKDVPASHWAADSINSAYAKGWVGGYENATFKPSQNISRAEVTKIVNTMLNRLPVEFPSNLLNPFTDLSDTHWAYPYIMEASTVHTYVRTEGGIESWEALISPATGEELVYVKSE